MKLISWNVNGIRACLQKGFEDAFRTLNADFFCLQETKAQPHQVELDLPGYRQYWYSAEKKGYSGTAIFARYEPLAVTYGVGVEELDHEGRLSTFFCAFSMALESILASMGVSSSMPSEFIMFMMRSEPNRRMMSSSSDR